jgi:hypothetical protein
MKTIGINLKDEIDPTGIMNEIEKMMRKHNASLLRLLE